jgi:thiamine biosynthesis lipoprotein
MADGLTDAMTVQGGIPGLFLPGLILLTLACSGPPASKSEEPPTAISVTETRVAMGTELRLTAWTTDKLSALAAFAEVFEQFDHLEFLMSTYQGTSEVLRLNASAGGEPVPVSPEVLEVLRQAREISEWTSGKFDITFDALSKLWQFDEDSVDRVPDMEDVQSRLSLIAYEDIEIDDVAGTVRLRRPGMSVNLGGIGKGYAVDRAVEILRARDLENFLIQAGGDLYVGGRPEGRPWRLGIQDPRGPAGSTFATIELSDATFSTSGDYERFFIADGRRYHHILDPDLGEPAMGSRSVTIVTAQAVMADALSTGVFILGPEAGMELIERLSGVEGVIVSAENEVLVSTGLRERLTWLSLPADGL